jgi:hypothetical protein
MLQKQKSGRKPMSEETHEESKKWTEQLHVKGGDLLATLNHLFHDVTVSRVIVYNKKGQKLVDIPFTIGAAGVLLTLPYSAILLGVMWLTEFDVAVERKGEAPEAEAETSATPQPEAEAAAAPPPAPDDTVAKSAEPSPVDSPEPNRCQGVTKAGTQCKRSAQDGSDYCAAHQPQA